MNRPRSWYNDDEPLIVRQVHEDERDTWTGLYDHNGTPLHRPREPIGYQPDRWRTQMPNPSQKSKPTKKGKGR